MRRQISYADFAGLITPLNPPKKFAFASRGSGKNGWRKANLGFQNKDNAVAKVWGVLSDGELQFNHSNKFAYTTHHPFINLPEITGQRCSFEAYSRAADGMLSAFDPQLSPPVGVAQSDFCPASVASSPPSVTSP